MFKLSVHFAMAALLMGPGAAQAQMQHGATSDSPSALYAKCTTPGSADYDNSQCVAFRTAADREIAACMGKGAANSHGYRALRLICADEQARRFTDLSE